MDDFAVTLTDGPDPHNQLCHYLMNKVPVKKITRSTLDKMTARPIIPPDMATRIRFKDLLDEPVGLPVSILFQV